MKERMKALGRKRRCPLLNQVKCVRATIKNLRLQIRALVLHGKKNAVPFTRTIKTVARTLCMTLELVFSASYLKATHVDYLRKVLQHPRLPLAISPALYHLHLAHEVPTAVVVNRLAGVALGVTLVSHLADVPQ